jgi:hypothetical protein
VSTFAAQFLFYFLRVISSRGLQESLCISLACYKAKSSEQKTIDQLSALPACWPQIGGLTMEVQYKGRREEFPLSPPFMVRCDTQLSHPGTLTMTYRLHLMGWSTCLNSSVWDVTSSSSIIALTCPPTSLFFELTHPRPFNLRRLLRDEKRNRNGRNGYDMFLGHLIYHSHPFLEACRSTGVAMVLACLIPRSLG